jgi:hypothetical protein
MSFRPDRRYPWVDNLGVIEISGGKWRRELLRGKCGPLDNEEAIRGDTARRVVMETSPASSFIMPEAGFLFQILVIALDAPAQFHTLLAFPPAFPGAISEERGAPPATKGEIYEYLQFYGSVIQSGGIGQCGASRATRRKFRSARS